jgi:molybdopterin/thiamine biosynthesis adenylyltransferase
LSETLATSAEFFRQLDIFDPSKTNPSITLIGAGALGSMIGLTLVKMGINDLTVWDNDTVELHNISNQFYPRTAVGKSKADAFKEMVELFSPRDIEIEAVPERFVSGDIYSEIVITALDNMKARRDVWKKAKDTAGVYLFIDVGMGAEILHVFTLNPLGKRRDEYEKKIYSHEDVELPCSARTIIYCPLLASSITASQVKKYAVQQSFPYHVCISMNDLSWVIDQ